MSVDLEFNGPSWALGVLTAGILTGDLSLWWLLLAPVFLLKLGSVELHIWTDQR